jgi:predicted permease
MSHRLRALVFRLLGSVRGARRDDDLSSELASHLQLHIDDNLRAGMAPDEARRRALLKLGGVEPVKEYVRDRRGLPWVDALVGELRYAARVLRRTPGFTVVAIITLALGIGATTAVFSVVDGVLLRPLPYPHPRQLVELRQAAPGAAGLASFADGLRLSPSMYVTYAEHNRTFQSLGVWTTGHASVTGVGEPEEVRTALVSDGVLETLAVPPAAGRWLSRADQRPHGPDVAMLSYGYWQRRFGGSPAVIGRRLLVDSRPRQIVGVMPQGFRIVDADFDLLLPLAFDRSELILAGFGYQGVARLRPGVTIRQADADVARMLPIWMHSWSNGPGTNPLFYEAWRITPTLRPLDRRVIGDVGKVLWAVMGAVGLTLLIACVNLAILLLVRLDGRQHELGVRAALGAGRLRIVGGLMAQSALLGAAGGALGLVVADGGLRLLLATAPATLPRVAEISLDARAFAFALLLSGLSILVFGLAPALQYTGRRLPLGLRSAGRAATASRSGERSRHTLVIAQVAAALVLLVSAGLLIRTFQALRSVDPGFSDPAHLQTFRIAMPPSLVARPEQVTRIQNGIADSIAAIPGVTSVGFANSMPMEGIETAWNTIDIEGRSSDGGPSALRLFKYVSPEFFQTAGTRLRAGRELTWQDVYGLRPVVLVSESLAREWWGSSSAAIGKRLREFDSMPWQEVIGVVQDVHENGVQEQAPPTVHWPTMMRDLYGPRNFDAVRAVTFVVRTRRAGTESFLHELRQAVWSVNAEVPVASVQTMGDIYARSMERTSFTLAVFAIAAVMALVLGLIGLYGVMAYATSRRTREIGIRLALGARPGQIVELGVKSGIRLVGFGIVIGAAGAIAVARVLSSLLYGVKPADPLTFAGMSFALAVVALLACYVPARRAAKVDPMITMRCE